MGTVGGLTSPSQQCLALFISGATDSFQKDAQGLRPPRLGHAGLLAEFESFLWINDQISADRDTTLLGRFSGDFGAIEFQCSLGSFVQLVIGHA